MKLKINTPDKLVVEYDFNWIMTVFAVLAFGIAAIMIAATVYSHITNNLQLSSNAPLIDAVFVIIGVVLLIPASKKELVIDKSSKLIYTQSYRFRFGKATKDKQMPLSDLVSIDYNFESNQNYIRVSKRDMSPLATIRLKGKNGQEIKFSSASSLSVKYAFNTVQTGKYSPEYNIAKEVSKYTGKPLVAKEKEYQGVVALKDKDVDIKE